MGNRRLFFAFWPDEPLRNIVGKASSGIFPLAGRPVDPASLHVTAAFLGTVSDKRLDDLKALCGSVPPLTMMLDRLEHWPKPRVLVATTTHLPEDVRGLVDSLWKRLDRLGFQREPRPYRPHLTLVRDVRSVRADLAWTPLAWPVERLDLIESVSTPAGTRYEPVTRAALPG